MYASFNDCVHIKKHTMYVCTQKVKNLSILCVGFSPQIEEKILPKS